MNFPLFLFMRWHLCWFVRTLNKLCIFVAILCIQGGVTTYKESEYTVNCNHKALINYIHFCTQYNSLFEDT